MIFAGKCACAERFKLIATTVFLAQNLISDLIQVDMGTGNKCWHSAD